MSGETIKNHNEQQQVIENRSIGAKVLSQVLFDKKHEEIVDSSYKKL